MGKLHIQAMDDHCSKLLVCLLLMLTTQVLSHDDPNQINITFIDTAVEKGAVCLDGSPPAYYYAPGFGDGANNWFVYLEGGAWCDTKDDCLLRSQTWLGSSYSRLVPSQTPKIFDGFLDQNPKTNPDFYNWNRVYIVYCDGSSFMGDVEEADPETNVTYRGARVFKAVIDELLLAKGMNNAQNAILSGSSAGGLATILNCDRFRQLVPHACRLKCLSDSGFFILEKSLNGAVQRTNYFSRVVKLHEIEKSFPESCTSKMNPGLCLFPENLVRDVKTPLFILESAFDSYQIPEMLVPYVGGKRKWKDCVWNITLCSSTEIQIMKDFRTAFIEKLKEIEDIPSLGMFVHNCYRHTHILDRAGWTCSFVVHNVLGNRTIGKAIGDWFFDRQCFKQIETSNDVPRNCTPTLEYKDFGQKCTDPVESAGWL